MSASPFEFTVSDAEQRKGTGLDRSYWVYKIYATTKLPQYTARQGSSGDVQLIALRRYSDFDWLRAQLCEEFTWCIVPPIPEKSMTGTVEKFVTSAHSPALIEYRQRALRKFLCRVGAHPNLRTSTVLQDFLEMNEANWERRMKQPKAPNQGENALASAIAGATALLSRQLYGAPQASDTAGQSYTKALQDAEFPPIVWEETKQYVAQLETAVVMLRDRLDALVKRRRETSHALNEFGRAFTRVGEIESNIETEKTLSNALQQVGRHSQHLSTIYLQHAEQELLQVVETLMYYHGLCAAVKETIARIQKLIATRDTTVQQLQDAIAALDKAKAQNRPEKIPKCESDVTTLTERANQIKERVVKTEAVFKEELRRFHREKQYDIKYLLRCFVNLQLDYARNMKDSWERLLPVVEEVRL